MNEYQIPHSAPPTPASSDQAPSLPAPCSLLLAPFPPASDLSPKRGRPRKLDELKRHEICALVAGGCSLREAAKYVGCGINTIRRELERHPEFGADVRHSQIQAQLSPLRAMQQAVTRHWRAAAWMLERAYPERFARRDPATFHGRQARKLLGEVIDIIRLEFAYDNALARAERRIRVAFEESIRAASVGRRSSGDLRQALEFMERHKEPDNSPESGGTRPDVQSSVESQDSPN